MHSVGSAQVKLFLSSHVLHVTQTFGGARPFWEPSFLFEAGKLAPYFFFFISCFGCEVKQSDSLVYFVTVDPYVLSLQVLFVCYCDHAASVQERLPGRNPAAVVKRRAETRSRIRADVESQTFRNETDFGHRCRLHCVRRPRRPTLTRTRTS